MIKRMGDQRKMKLNRRNALKMMGGGLALAAAPGMSAVASDDASKVIGFAHPDRTAAFFKGLTDAVKAQAAEYGYEIRQTSSGFDSQAQVAELEAWLASGIDAMTVGPVDPAALAPIVQKCKEQGVFYVSYGVRVEGAAGHVGFDDFNGGVELGHELVKHINEHHDGEAEIGFLTFVNHKVTRDRLEGVKSVLMNDLPNTQIYEAEAVNADAGLAATQSLLTAHPNLQIVISCTDDAALGARSAFLSNDVAKEGAFIAGFDGAHQNLDFIKANDPYIRAAAALDIDKIGRSCVSVPHALFSSTTPSESDIIVEVPYVLVTSETDAQTLDRLLSIYKA